MREVVNAVFYVPAASRKRVAGEDFAAMSNSDPTLFERLAKVEPAKLARLLVELAAQDQTILEQVQLLLASGDTAAIAKAVRSTLRAWKRSPRFIHYQEAFAFGEQLDRLLDSPPEPDKPRFARPSQMTPSFLTAAVPTEFMP